MRSANRPAIERTGVTKPPSLADSVKHEPPAEGFSGVFPPKGLPGAAEQALDRRSSDSAFFVIIVKL